MRSLVTAEERRRFAEHAHNAANNESKTIRELSASILLALLVGAVEDLRKAEQELRGLEREPQEYQPKGDL